MLLNLSKLSKSVAVFQQHVRTIRDYFNPVNIFFLPKTQTWSGRRGSNPRHLPWQGSALPTELHPHHKKTLEFLVPGPLSLLYAENYDPRESSKAGPVLPGKFTIFNIIVYYISS